MPAKRAQFIPRGMTRDLAVSKFSPEYAYENKNLRITATDENTTFVLSNERGNSKVTSGIFADGIKGTPIGQSILNDTLVLFTTGEDPEPEIIQSLHNKLGGPIASIKRYSSYEDAANDINGQQLTSAYSEGDYNYVIGEAGDYIAYKEGDYRIVAFSDNPSAIPILQINVDVDSNTLYYVTEVIEDEEPPFSNSVDFKVTYTPPKKDRIYKIQFNSENNLVGEVLYNGNLNFSESHPIESISIFENDELQKVYWVDGYNQPRVININSINNAWNNNSFEFLRNISGSESVLVSKNLEVGGEFAPGVIQYYFTYFDMYGQETNIFASSPQLYTSYLDRGASPDSKVSTGFNIKITNVDSNFDKIRIYSILRTSLDAVPQARIVKDFQIIKRTGAVDEEVYDSIEYIDTGIEGQTIDPTVLLFKNRAPITAETLSQKDNTLFLGNIKSKVLGLSKTIKDSIRTGSYTITEDEKLNSSGLVTNSYYAYTNQLQYDSYSIKNFKRSDYYRLGIQFKHETGYWSEAVYINDYQITTSPRVGTLLGERQVFGNKLVATINNASVLSQLYNLGFREARPVIVYPSINDRECICQGILCPTVYNALDRVNNSPFAQASWFTRPTAPFGPEYAQYTYDLATTSYLYRDLSDKDTTSSVDQKYGENSIKGLMMNNSFKQNIRTGPLFHRYNNFYINKYGAWPEFRHNYPIPGNNNYNAEIQCIVNPPHPYLGVWTFIDSPGDEYNYREKSTSKEWAYDNQECFYVDQSIITLHSPDIEFNTELHNFDLTKLKLRIVGKTEFVSSISDISIQTDTATLPITDPDNHDIVTMANGFYHQQIGAKYTSHFGWKGLIASPLWFDGAITNENPQLYLVGYVTYPWHRNGSLNNDKKEEEEYTISSRLKRKVQSTLRYGETSYFSDFWYAEEYGSSTHTGISGAQLFESSEMSLIKIPAPKNSSMQDIIYYGNVDKVVIQHLISKAPLIDGNVDKYIELPLDRLIVKEGGAATYPIIISRPYYNEDPDAAYEPNQMFNGSPTPMKYIYRDNDSWAKETLIGDVKYSTSTDPVSMKYKSTPHAVLALNYTEDGKQRILPYIDAPITIKYNGDNSATVRESNTSINRNATGEWVPFESGLAADKPTVSNNPLFWDEDGTITGVSQDRIDFNEGTGNGYLWIGELYNDNVINRFGGVSEEAFANNNWTPCGPSVAFTDSTSSITINYVEGDTYFQRYDCLKTYPYTQEDQNSIVDIASFECETRVNIDGRYDRNRGLTNNLNVSPQNFNLLNPVYSQSDNFLIYHGKDSTKIEVTDYPNTLTWTKTKTLGEEVDSWTDVTMASTLDLDGDLGQLRALRRFGDNIIAFQDNGISQILYNDNVQIASTTGVPIEIANSGKVSGKRYITNQIGCINKWSICTTPNGLYFIDDLRKDFYLFNGQLNNISEKLGFHSWMINNFGNPSIWNPRDFSNCTTLYDRVNDEVLITLNDTALAFSENLNGFTSFYDYGRTSFMSNLRDRVIAWHTDSSDNYAPWMHHEGDYNSFYGEYKPFWTTVIVNPEPTMDKVFNNVEYRADVFDMDDQEKYLKDLSFDTLNVWNEYQAGIANLEDIKNIPSNLKKKFRIWRANIPRWNIDTNGQTANGRDRMRNPWLYLKLSMEKSSNLSNNHKTILHDMIVDYFE